MKAHELVSIAIGITLTFIILPFVMATSIFGWFIEQVNEACNIAIDLDQALEKRVYRAWFKFLDWRKL